MCWPSSGCAGDPDHPPTRPASQPSSMSITTKSCACGYSGKRRTTGMKKGMKESYIEDLANHGGPDHALVTREGAAKRWICLLYTSDAADEEDSVDLGGR